ncbi:MAG: FixH family protein [Verrucomicrobiales bacterium]|nr:FixH family protein [Verrucomicrobiales bacterium]
MTSTSTSPTSGARRNPWPYGILAAFVVFVGGLVTLVTTAQRHGRSELVAPDYYDQEIRYQTRMNAERRTAAIQGDIRVDYDASTQTVAVGLPRQHGEAGVEGMVEFYRPSGAAQDRALPLRVQRDGTQIVEARGLTPGPWDIRLRWQSGTEEFATSRRILVAGVTKP